MVNKLKKEWEDSQMMEWFEYNNWDRIYDLAEEELVIKKSDLGWWRRNWNTSKDLDWVQERAEELLNKEFDALRGKNE